MAMTDESSHGTSSVKPPRSLLHPNLYLPCAEMLSPIWGMRVATEDPPHPHPVYNASQDASADFCKGIQTLGCYGDYLVVNVSSPNTPGLRNLQRVAAIRAVITTAMKARDKVGRRMSSAYGIFVVLGCRSGRRVTKPPCCGTEKKSRKNGRCDAVLGRVYRC